MKYLLQEQSNQKKKKKTIYIEMEVKEIDKPSQVSEFQLSLAIVITMSRVGKEWEDIAELIFGSNKNNLRFGNPTTKEVYPIVGREQENEETNQRVLEGK